MVVRFRVEGQRGRAGCAPNEPAGLGAVPAHTRGPGQGTSIREGLPTGERGAPLTFWMARARDTPGSPTSWRVFLPRTWNFCLLTFTSNGFGLGLAPPPRAPAGVFVRAPAALAFPMAFRHRTPRRPTLRSL